MHISFGKGFHDLIPKTREMTFAQFAKLVADLPIHVGRLHWTEYCAADKATRARDKDTAWIIPASFTRQERKADAIKELSGFTCDFDDGAIDRSEIESGLRGSNFIAWTSYSHGLGGLSKWRVFIPYAHPITPDRHLAVYEHFNKIFSGHLDPRCATISQLWYLRGRPQGAPASHLFGVYEGDDLDPGQLVASGGSDVSGGLPVGTLPSLAALAAAHNSDLTGRGPTSILDIKSALAALDPALYEDYTEWLNMGMSIYDGTSGSPEGLDIYDAWSATCPGYAGPDSVRAKWFSFGGRAGLSRRTVASLFKQAQEAGWSPGHNNIPIQPSVPSPSLPIPASQPTAVPQNNAVHTASPVQLVLPLIVTALPKRWREHPKECAMQREEENPDTGGTQWITRIRETRLVSIEMLEAIGGGPNGICNLQFRCADKIRNARIALSLISKPADLRGELAACGVLVGNDDFKCLQELIVEWLQKIKRENKVKKSLSHLGWLEDEGVHVGFASGTSAYYANGTEDAGIQITTAAGSLSAHYKPMGDITPWRAITAFLVGQKQQALLTVLASAFASPLVKFSGVSGVVVSVISTASGVGKSSALTAAQATWGDPKGAIHAATDTPLSLSKKMGFTRNLPAYWDDIKGERTFEAFAELLFQITQGKEKSRLDASANLRQIETWDCLAVVAANDSIVEISKRYSRGSDAGISRIFEIRLDERPLDVQSATFFDGCRNNYGHAGAIYAKWLASNRPVAEAAVLRTTERLSASLGMQSEERFWIATIACMVVGARLAKLLTLVDFDVVALETFLVERFQALRGNKGIAVQEVGPDRQVADLIYDHQSTTLLIEEIPKFNKGKAKPVVIRPPKNGVVDILLVRQDDMLRVRKAKFHEWCRVRGLSADTLKTKLDQVGAISERNTDPMAGTQPYSQGSRTTCYDIDLKKLGIQGDEDVDPAQTP